MVEADHHTVEYRATVLSGHLTKSCSHILLLREEKVTFHFGWGRKEFYSWKTPRLADAVGDRIAELPFVVLKKVSTQESAAVFCRPGRQTAEISV